MSRSLQTLAVLALLAGVAACQDSGSTTGTSSDLLVADGFETLGWAGSSGPGSTSACGTAPSAASSAPPAASTRGSIAWCATPSPGAG